MTAASPKRTVKTSPAKKERRLPARAYTMVHVLLHSGSFNMHACTLEAYTFACSLADCHSNDLKIFRCKLSKLPLDEEIKILIFIEIKEATLNTLIQAVTVT